MSAISVHILMPTHNVTSYINEPIKSIQNQDYPEIKTIIYDDGSTDQTVRVLRELTESDRRFNIYEGATNQGTALARRELVSLSKKTDERACFLWLDGDDYFTDPSFISKFVKQMDKTGADVCLYNFDVRFESPDLIANAAGLLRDQANSEIILDKIASSPGEISSVKQDNDIGTFTSLGCTKGYSPDARWPSVKPDGIFEDFVYMAALYTARSVTAFPSTYKPASFLRRSSSSTGSRTPQTFVDVTSRLGEFLDNVSQTDQELVPAAMNFTGKKIDQYGMILKQIMTNGTNLTIGQDVLDRYRADSLKLGIQYD